MSKLRLTLACWNYDRTRALLDGSRAARRHRAQLSQSAGGRNLLPHAAPSRIRRGGAVAVLLHAFRCSAKIRPSSRSRCSRRAISGTPASMSTPAAASASPRIWSGKRIGNPEYQMTAPVWIRGILSDEYGVPVTSVDLFERRRGAARAHRKDRAVPAAGDPHSKPSRPIRRFRRCSRPARSTRCTRRARPPRSSDGSGKVRRLVPGLPDGRARILPEDEDLSDHARDRDPPRCVRTNRWVAQSLYKAFVDGAEARCTRTCATPAALKIMLPWLTQHVEETERSDGPRFLALRLRAQSCTR